MPFQRRPKDCGANCSKSDVESPGCSWEFQTLWQPPKRFNKVKFYHSNHQSLFNFFRVTIGNANICFLQTVSVLTKKASEFELFGVAQPQVKGFYSYKW